MLLKVHIVLNKRANGGANKSTPLIFITMFMALELAQFSLLLLPLMKLKIPYLSFPRLLWVSAMESPGSLGLAQLHNQLCRPPHLNHNHSAFLGAVAMVMSGRTESRAR